MWIQGDNKISKVVIRCLKKSFNIKEPILRNEILDCIPKCISKDDNRFLSHILKEDKIKKAIFDLSINSSASPDGYTDFLFLKTWQLIKNNMVSFVQDFFNGENSPNISLIHA